MKTVLFMLACFSWVRFTLNIILFGIVHFFETLLSISTWFFFMNCFSYTHIRKVNFMRSVFFLSLSFMRSFVRPFDRTLSTLFIGAWLFQFCERRVCVSNNVIKGKAIQLMNAALKAKTTMNNDWTNCAFTSFEFVRLVRWETNAKIIKLVFELIKS